MLIKPIILILFVVSGILFPKPSNAQQLTLAVAGDVLFARGIAKVVQKEGDNKLFDGIKAILKKADLSACNLECVLSSRGESRRLKYIFRAPTKYAKVLKDAGFNIAVLANNHTMDFGRDAMLDTKIALEKQSITAVGAGKNRADVSRVKVIEKKGIKIGLLAYNDIALMGISPLDDKPSVLNLRDDSMPSEIKAAKTKCDVLVVFYHWGLEYMKQPTQRQITLAKSAIDSGADLIIGCHPHVIQKTMIYKNKPIAFSTGGCLWDSKIFGSNKSEILIFDITKKTITLKSKIPIKIINCKPVKI